MKHVEWKHGTFTLIQRQFILMMSLDITTHKSKGRNLEMAIIDLGKSKKYASMTLVALSCVKNIVNMLLRSFCMSG